MHAAQALVLPERTNPSTTNLAAFDRLKPFPDLPPAENLTPDT
jgi:hypothetical protein